MSPGEARVLIEYNCWANQLVCGSAGALTSDEFVRHMGSSYGSVRTTLVHILWGDGQWMSRFDGWQRPATPIKESDRFIQDWAELCGAREKADADIARWARNVDEKWLDADLTWFSGAANREVTAPKRLLVAHFFNHQTHHRGQAHTLLTAAGQQTGDTDLFLVVPEMLA